VETPDVSHRTPLAHPEWHALFDMDKEKGAATRKRIYGMGFVQRAGPAYRWLPLTYQLAGLAVSPTGRDSAATRSR
jgi:hypothetical protein